MSVDKQEKEFMIYRSASKEVSGILYQEFSEIGESRLVACLQSGFPMAPLKHTFAQLQSPKGKKKLLLRNFVLCLFGTKTEAAVHAWRGCVVSQISHMSV
jgi:hypothetical protein